MALVFMGSHGWGTLFIDPSDIEAGVGLQSSFTNPADATAATHYADSAGSSPSTGPVTADANGRLTRWIEEGTYTQTLPGGSTVEVHAVSGATVAKVAPSEYLLPAATGVKATDTTNIMAFLNGVSSAGAAIGRLRRGDYSIDPLSVPVLSAGALVLEGQGPDKTKLNFAGSSGYGITVSDGVTESRWVKIRDLSLIGNANADGGIKLNYTKIADIERVVIQDFSKAGVASLYIAGGGTLANYFPKMSHCQFRNSPIGIFMDGGTGIGANSNYVEFCHFGVHSSYAIHISGASSSVIFANEFNGSIATAVRIEGNADNNKVCFNQFDGPTTSVNIVDATCDRTQLIGNSGMFAVTDNGTNTVRFDADEIRIGSNTVVVIPTGLKMGGYTLTLPTNGIGVGGDIRTNSQIYADMSEAGEIAIGALGPASEAAVKFNRGNVGITGERIYLYASSLLRTGGKLTADAGLGVGNSAAATEVIGKAVVKKIQIFDHTGASLGYIPVYSSIT